MPNSQNKLDDKKATAVKLAKFIKREMFLAGMSSKEVSLIFGKDKEDYLSSLLGTRPTSNIEIYRSIAHKIGLSDTRFDEIVGMAEIEVVQEKHPKMFANTVHQYALSHRAGSIEDARAKAEKTIQELQDLLKKSDKE